MVTVLLQCHYGNSVTMVTVLLQCSSLFAGSYFQMGVTVQISRMVTGEWIFMLTGEERTVLSLPGCTLTPTFTTSLLSLRESRMHVHTITVWMHTPYLSQIIPNQGLPSQVQLKQCICLDFRWDLFAWNSLPIDSFQNVSVKCPYFRGAKMRSRGSCTTDLSPWEKQLLLSFGEDSM